MFCLIHFVSQMCLLFFIVEPFVAAIHSQVSMARYCVVDVQSRRLFDVTMVPCWRLVSGHVVKSGLPCCLQTCESYLCPV